MSNGSFSKIKELPSPTDVESWACEDVREWLSKVDLEQYSKLLCDEHLVDGNVLLSLHEKDLRDPPLAIKVLGDIKRLNKAIRNLRKDNLSNGSLSERNEVDFSSTRSSLPRRQSSIGDEWSVDGPFSVPSPRQGSIGDSHDNTTPRKVFFSSLYVWFVFLLTSFTMTVVHSRLPDMATYRPLPDIALDNIPHIPWAFQVSEAIGVFYMILLLAILIFHKHRLLIICRLNILLGTAFLLRCCTMFVTSLSVPGQHLHCQPEQFLTYTEMFYRALEITSGFGMSLTGVHTCGDYMFSGHTVVLTMLNLAITEYTPRRFRSLHLLTWVMNIFGIFFILAAHEHYSIDVVVAFVITSRMFLYYHALANSRALTGGDQHRLRDWFPMFTYVEQDRCGDRIVNIFANPVTDLRAYLSHRFGTAGTKVSRKTE